jgi:protein arginine kinase activator
LQQTVNGETKNMYLCTDCAEGKEFGISFGTLLQGFLESFFGQQAGFSYEKKDDAPETPAVRCSSCGLTYEDFKKTGKLGCAGCYGAFKEELGAIIKNIQGSNVHAGKYPKRGGEGIVKKREIDVLKERLKRAVEAEEYEEAAKIRDEIRGRG